MSKNFSTKKEKRISSFFPLFLCMMLLLFGAFPKKAEAITPTEPEYDTATQTYLINSAEELVWFAKRVNDITGSYAGINGKLTDDIIFNEGVTFSYTDEEDDLAAIRVRVLDGTGVPKGYLLGSGRGVGIVYHTSYDETSSQALGRGQWYKKINWMGKLVVQPDTAPTLEEWMPIGIVYGFKGNFDGGNHTISGLYCNIELFENTGLFGRVIPDEAKEIKNIRLERCCFFGTKNVGGICGSTNENATISNCFNEGIVNGETNTGGIVGLNEGTVMNCAASGTSILTKKTIGGICGENTGFIQRCISNGKVRGIRTPGGICGVNGGTIENCFSTEGNIYGTKSSGAMTKFCFYVAQRHTENGDGTFGKRKDQFASGEVAWLLNTSYETKESSQTFGQGTDYPVFANQEHPAITKVAFQGASGKAFYVTKAEAEKLTPNSDSALKEETIHIAMKEDGSGYATDEDGNYIVDMALTSAAPILTDSIALKFSATLSDELCTPVPQMKFVFRGETVYANGVKNENESGNGYSTYEYIFSGILPQFMCENIEASINISGLEIKKSNYSVRSYALAMLDQSIVDLYGDFSAFYKGEYNCLRNLLVSMLYYGAASQKYLNSGIAEESLATFGLSDTQKALNTDKEVEYHPTGCINEQGFDGEIFQWKKATLVLKERVTLRLGFQIPTNVLIGDVIIKVSKEGNEIATIYGGDSDLVAGIYYVNYSGIAANEFGDDYTFTIYNGETKTGSSLSYSINAYIYYIDSLPVDTANAPVKAFTKAINNYGKAVEAYVTATTGVD